MRTSIRLNERMSVNVSFEDGKVSIRDCRRVGSAVGDQIADLLLDHYEALKAWAPDPVGDAVQGLRLAEVALMQGGMPPTAAGAFLLSAMRTLRRRVDAANQTGG